MGPKGSPWRNVGDPKDHGKAIVDPEDKGSHKVLGKSVMDTGGPGREKKAQKLWGRKS